MVEKLFNMLEDFFFGLFMVLIFLIIVLLFISGYAFLVNQGASPLISASVVVVSMGIIYLIGFLFNRFMDSY